MSGHGEPSHPLCADPSCGARALARRGHASSVPGYVWVLNLCARVRRGQSYTVPGHGEGTLTPCPDTERAHLHRARVRTAQASTMPGHGAKCLCPGTVKARVSRAWARRRHALQVPGHGLGARWGSSAFPMSSAVTSDIGNYTLIGGECSLRVGSALCCPDADRWRPRSWARIKPHVSGTVAVHGGAGEVPESVSSFPCRAFLVPGHAFPVPGHGRLCRVCPAHAGPIAR